MQPDTKERLLGLGALAYWLVIVIPLGLFALYAAVRLVLSL
jgi:hypothetical protein